MRVRTFPFGDSSRSGVSAAGRVALVRVLWASVHSVLASKQAEDLARRAPLPQ